MRRCHFVDEVIGNIYKSGWQASLRPRECPNAHCQCYLGFAHLAHLRLEQVFGDGILERISCSAKTQEMKRNRSGE
jgi:hypothetical protein